MISAITLGKCLMRQNIGRYLRPIVAIGTYIHARWDWCCARIFSRRYRPTDSMRLETTTEDYHALAARGSSISESSAPLSKDGVDPRSSTSAHSDRRLDAVTEVDEDSDAPKGADGIESAVHDAPRPISLSEGSSIGIPCDCHAADDKDASALVTDDAIEPVLTSQRLDEASGGGAADGIPPVVPDARPQNPRHEMLSAKVMVLAVLARMIIIPAIQFTLLAFVVDDILSGPDTRLAKLVLFVETTTPTANLVIIMLQRVNNKDDGEAVALHIALQSLLLFPVLSISTTLALSLTYGSGGSGG